MKKVLLLLITMLAVFSSCKKGSTEPVEMEAGPPKEAELVEPPGDQCYVYKKDNNTVSLSFKVNTHQDFIGKLSYDLVGKDKNDGLFIGSVTGDTLIGDYTFKSEGVESMREVAFLQKDGAYIEGYGDVMETNGRMVFKDKKKLKFDTNTRLTKVDCVVK
jgi:hypothetical protein